MKKNKNKKPALKCEWDICDENLIDIVHKKDVEYLILISFF